MKTIYSKPVIEVVEVEMEHAIMQFSAGDDSMNDIELQNDKKTWSGLNWD